MKAKKISKDKRYNIVISSLTDAKKKTRTLTMTRSGIITSVISIVMVIVISVGAAVYSVSRAAERQAQSDTLAGRVNEQMALLSDYETRLSVLQVAKAEREAAAAAQSSQGLTMAENAQGTSAVAQATVEPLVFVSDAVRQINDEYCGEINAQVDALKQVSTADAVDVIYSGDLEGDSDTVNNWSEVLAVFVVETGYDLKTLTVITETECGLLEQIYRDMNRYEITSQTVAVMTPSGDEQQTVYSTLMTINIAVCSIGCDEYADELRWDRDKKRTLERLRSNDYNMTYAALLGVDLYEGLNSEELAEIISGLDPDRIGTIIVQAALTRLGDPYGRGGNRVDCSSFAYWAYKQAGITIPSTSVEQAKYCYNNGYVVSFDDLLPGDLLFWQKTSCHCGRWREIHHAGIYIGNGLVIESSSSKGCVVIRKVWGQRGEWRLCLAARPYTEQASTVSAAPTVSVNAA